MQQHDTENKRNAAANMLTLRRWLKLTQREFIDTYLLDGQGKPLISVATLSGVENGTQNNVLPLTAAISEKLRAEADVFTMDPDSFAKNIELFFKSYIDESNVPIKQKSSAEPLVQVLSNYLTDAIVRGELKPGDKLPSERSLSALLGVGRGAVREALKVLSALGLINILQGQGTFIALEPTDFYITPLSWTLFIGQQGAGHLLDMRNLLEMETARLAAGADEAAQAEFTVQYMYMCDAYKTANFQDFLDSDLDFHLAIARCSGNPIIHNLLQTSRQLLSHISQSGMMSVAQIDEIAAEHSSIYTAIINGDGDTAAREMEKHLKRARGRYKL